MLAVYRATLSTLSGMVLVWMWTIMRERRRTGDYLHGEWLAAGVILFCVGTIVGQAFAWVNDLRFSPGSIFAFVACILFLVHMGRVIHTHREP